jgi:hypothetical protein
MSITLDDTVGGASSNTYVSIADADTYFEERLHSSVWTAASIDTKKAALVWATRILDRSVEWVGTIKTTTQALRWPRSGVYTSDYVSISSTIVPEFVKYAVCELAKQLISSDKFADHDTKGYKWMQVGGLQIQIDKYDRPQVLSKAVWWYIMEYASSKVSQRRILERC